MDGPSLLGEKVCSRNWTSRNCIDWNQVGDFPVTEKTTIPPARARHSFINHCI